jgi:hypothetical protein
VRRVTADLCRRRLRAALTWRERVRQDSEADAAAQQRAMEAVLEARRAIDRALADADRRHATAQAQLEAVRADAAAGRGAPEALNEAHRTRAAELGAVEEERDLLAALRRAETAEEAGGALDATEPELALLAKPARAAREPGQRPGSGLRIAAICGVLLAWAATALPWAEAAGVRAAAWDLGRVLRAAGVLASPGESSALLWFGLACAILPLLTASPLFLPRSGPVSAWLVYGGGALMAAVAFLPAFVLATRSPDAAVRLLRLPLAGAWVYLAAGAIFLGLAGRLRDRVARRAETGWRDVAMALALVVLAFGVVAGAVAAVPRAGDLALTVLPPEADAIAVEVRNGTRGSLALYVGWSRDAGAPVTGERPTAGLDVALLRTGRESEPVPPSAQRWRVAGGGALLGGALDLTPGATARLLLDAGPLRRRYRGGEVRLRLVDAAGRPLATANAVVPPPPGPGAAPAPVRQPVGESATSRATPDETPPAPGLSDPAPPESALPSPEATLAFRGVVGNEALFELRSRPGAAPERIRAAVGEGVVGGWRLAQIAGRPPEAVLVHDDLQQLVRVTRGRSLPLLPDPVSP